MDERVRELLEEVGVAAPAEDEVTIVGHDPVLGNRFPVGEAAAAALAAGGVVVSNLWEQQTGRRQRVRVEVRHAGLTQRAPLMMRLNGDPPPPGPAEGNPLVALYRCQDGRWVHLHGAFPHLAEGTLEVLGCARDRDAIGRAVATWDGETLENALAEQGLCGAMARTWDEWQAHPQGRALADVPRVEIHKLAESDPEPLPGLGATCDPAQASGPGDPADLLVETPTAWGTLRHLKPAVHLSETEPFWSRPPAPLGTHPAAWPARSGARPLAV